MILAVDDGEGGDVDPEISFDELFNYLVAVRRVRVRIAIVSLLCCAGLCAVLTVRSRTPLSLSPLLSLSLSLSFAADGAIAPEHVGDGR